MNPVPRNAPIAAASQPPHTLVLRLVELHGYPLADAGRLDELLAMPGNTLVFCGGDPGRHPECLDVAVVLPELLAAFPGRLRAVVAGRETEPALQARYGFQLWPTLLLLRDGDYVGAISGMQDWGVYLRRLGELLAAPAVRPPSVGIAVAATGHAASCH